MCSDDVPGPLYGKFSGAGPFIAHGGNSTDRLVFQAELLLLLPVLDLLTSRAMELEGLWWKGQLAADIHQALRYKVNGRDPPLLDCRGPVQ